MRSPTYLGKYDKQTGRLIKRAGWPREGRYPFDSGCGVDANFIEPIQIIRGAETTPSNVDAET
jgi:hypothetical protein